MAKRVKLTFFSRLLIVLAIVAAVFFGVRWALDNTSLGELTGQEGGGAKPVAAGDIVRVGVVDWVGYAGGQYFNEGFEPTKDSRFYKDYGFMVDFQVINDPEASLAAWKKGDLDLHWFTLDAFPTIYESIRDYDPVILFQADWSRGGDAIVVKRGINSVKDLKGKKVAVAERTPSHSFLLWLLDAGGLDSEKDITIVPTADAIQAGEFFKGGQVDAAVTWSPTDEECVRVVTGARILESTRSASNIIADIFFAKRDYVEANRDKLQQLYEGWMIGAAEIASDPSSKQKAISILAKGLNYPESDILIDNARHTNHGDNINFFGLNSDYQGVTADALYRRMAQEYKALGYAEETVPRFRNLQYPYLVQNTQLSGGIHEAEAKKTFVAVDDAEGVEKEAIATKRVSISFRTAEYELDDNAKTLIDLQFVDIAKAFGNARIRIEGNTDNVGNRQSNIALSKRRAEAVKNYLVQEHGMSPNRFIVVGNGPDKPVAKNNTADGKAQNRRTDFELVRE
ncbi:MAG: phosphate ABC transporter substrate-binding/OmpA family protein [Bacteroidota bacterium]